MKTRAWRTSPFYLFTLSRTVRVRSFWPQLPSCIGISWFITVRSLRFFQSYAIRVCWSSSGNTASLLTTKKLNPPVAIVPDWGSNTHIATVYCSLLHQCHMYMFISYVDKHDENYVVFVTAFSHALHLQQYSDWVFIMDDRLSCITTPTAYTAIAVGSHV